LNPTCHCKYSSLHIFASVVERYSTDKEGTEEEFEEGDIEVEKTSTAKAIEALEHAKLWKLL
jgi:hypothetical protein